MEMNRRQTLGVLGLAAVAAALPASAAKASTPPEFTSMSFFASGIGGVAAAVRCAIPVVSVTARLLSNDRTVEIDQFDLERMPETSPTWGTWLGPQLTGLPLGNYWVEYEATSEDGGVATGDHEFVLWLFPTYGITVAPTEIDDIHRVVTVSGTVVGRHPVTQAVAPIAGMPVGVGGHYWPVSLPDPPPGVVVTSAADGTFTAQLTLAGSARISAATGGEPREIFVVHGSSESVQVTVGQRSTRLSAGIDDTEFNIGQTATVSGVLEGSAEGQWRPMAARTVFIGFLPTGDNGPITSWQEATTDAQGRYALTVAPRVKGRYVAQFNSETFYTGTSAETSSVLVRWPLVFDDNHIWIGPTPDSRDHPNLFEMGGPFESESGISLTGLVVHIQFRARVADPWQTLATTVAEGSYRFVARFTPPGSGQVRAFVPQNDYYQASSSQVYHVNIPRIPERPLSPNPTPGTLPPQRRI